MKLERMVLGYPVRVDAVKLDEGWDIGVFGGCRTHVGAVTLAEPCGTVNTMERPHHRDRVVSEKWACVLSEKLNQPVCVRCGIHYDNPSKSQIDDIVACCDDLLHQLVNMIIIT